jgi:arsenite-transporting ATPase
MLTMPESLRRLARVFDQMQEKHRVVVEALRGGWVPDAEDALIGEIDREGRALHALLRDPALVHVSWVTLPESMAIEETADAAAALSSEGIPLRDVIVNRLTPRPERRCGWCNGRRDLERRALVAMQARVPGVHLIGIAERAAEPHGRRALAGIGAEIAAGKPALSDGRGSGKATWRASAPVALNPDILSLIAGDDTRLILFGGKGGVGKTTCAAAGALAVAAARPRRRVLLLSTDPAHSLADVFGTPIADSPATIRGGPPNLEVREIDAARAFQAVREGYATAIDSLFDRLIRRGGVGLDASHDRQVMHGLIDLAPPGIDELVAVIDVTDAIDSSATGIVIMDTAPSGHALRLLEMPTLVQDWTKALMSILLKYQPVVGVGELGSVLLKLSQGLGRLRALLVDSRRTSFVVVTRAARLPRAETHRLMRRLHGLHIHVPMAIVNAVGRGTCARCRAVAAVEQREITRLRRAMPRQTPIVVAPVELPPPHGPAALGRWQRTWRWAAKDPVPAGISSKRVVS